MTDSLKNPERQLVSIAHIITRGAEIYPERVAIDDLYSGRTLTYRQLDDRITQLARALSTLGIEKGDMVGVMLWNEHPVVEIIMACARMGAVVAPMNVRLLPDEVATFANHHGFKAIVTRPDFAPCFDKAEASIRIAVNAAEAPGNWNDYETILSAEPVTPLPVVTSLDDPFRMVLTGGTTGMSKGVIHSHVGVYFTVMGVIAEYAVRRGWKTIMIMPSYHAAGMDWGMFPIFWRAGTVVFPEDTSFNPAAYFAEIKARGVEYLQMVPAVVNPLYQAWDGQAVTEPKVAVSTAAPTPPALRQRLAEMFPETDVFAAAGLSETLNMAAPNPGELLTFPEAVGEPYIDTRCLILGEDDQELPRGEPGEIALRGFNTALTYSRNPEASAVTWRPRKGDPEGLHWCFTGDVGVMDEAGRVSIVDRSKDVIITGGETVPSVEIESIYMDHPQVLECAAVGVEDERWGEAIMLILARADQQAGPPDAEAAAALYTYGRETLAPFKVPTRIAFMDALPRSHFGKILKRDLRDMEFKEVFER